MRRPIWLLGANSPMLQTRLNGRRNRRQASNRTCKRRIRSIVATPPNSAQFVFGKQRQWRQEMAMKSRSMTILLSCIAAAMACQAGLRPAGASEAAAVESRAYRAEDGRSLSRGLQVSDNASPTAEPQSSGNTTRRLLRNIVDCAPERAEAVWGSDEKLLGYFCHDPNE